MNRFDRALAILLLLRSGSAVTAGELAGRFEVSTRTIYRDIETLSMVGVPIYAERGRDGGIRLVEGYFLPPVTLTRDEAISLLLGLTILRGLRSRPFAEEMETAEAKLLAALPNKLRAALEDARRVIGSETPAEDAFHPDPGESRGTTGADERAVSTEVESETVATFLTAILDQRAVAIRYKSPYRVEAETLAIAPLGVFWDRDRWYLAGRSPGRSGVRFWRADRVLDLEMLEQPVAAEAGFDVRDLMGRKWLSEAMERWARESPVRIRVSAEQADRLKRDWYYCHAGYEDDTNGGAIVTFGEDNRQVVFDLLRWLGPGAELLRPKEWRSSFREELIGMIEAYS